MSAEAEIPDRRVLVIKHVRTPGNPVGIGRGGEGQAPPLPALRALNLGGTHAT
jgi:hypothetical protein